MGTVEFTTIIERTAGLQGAEAARATRATLTTLAERLSPAEARDLTEALLPELGPWLFTTEPAEGFDVDEFLRRVARRAEVDIPTAERLARGVFLALARTLDEDEFADVQSLLPRTSPGCCQRGRRSRSRRWRRCWSGSRNAPGATSTAPAGPPRPYLNQGSAALAV